MKISFKKLIIPIAVLCALILPQVSFALHDGTIHAPIEGRDSGNIEAPIEGQDEREFGESLRTQTNQPSGDGNKKIDAIRTSIDNVVCAFVGGNFILSGVCIAKFFAYTSFIWLNIVGLLLNIAGLIFNATLGITIDNFYYNYQNVEALRLGWTFSRDIVNLFFIFILLFIAIATILQIESYGAKQLLTKLIVIALLVNFSFLAAQMIIFISNALAVTIYNAQDNIGQMDSGFASFLQFKFKKDISGNIVGAFNPQRLFLKLPVEQVQITTDTKNALTILLAIIEIGVLGSIIILTAAFVLFAGAFFFITRLAVLWLLLILAPFGFVFLILPITKGYAQAWWKKLFEQATFAPVFMFLLVLAIIIIQSGLVDFLGKAQSINNMAEFLFLIFLQASIMIVMLIAALLVAKQMGIYGAGAAIKMAQNAGKAFRGYAGRTAMRQVGRSPIVGWAGAFSAQLARIPLAGRLMRPVARGIASTQAQARKTYDEQAKAFTNLPPKETARVLRSASPELQRAILDKVKSKKRELTLEEMGSGEVVKLGRNMKAFGMEKDVAKASNSLVRAMEIMHPDIDKTKEPERYQEEMNQWFNDLNNRERAELNPEEIAKNENVQNTIFQTVNIGGLSAMLKNRKQRDAFAQASQTIIEKNENLVNVKQLLRSGVPQQALKRVIKEVYGNEDLSEKINQNLATSLIAGTIKVSSKEEYTLRPTEEEAEGGATI